MSDETAPVIRCSYDIARRVKNLVRELGPRLAPVYGLDEAGIDNAVTYGLLRVAVYRYVDATDIADDDRRQLVQEVAEFIEDFLQAKGV
jgi:hypothetical protein